MRYKWQQTRSVRRFILMRFLESVHEKFNCVLIILLTNGSAHRDWCSVVLGKSVFNQYLDLIINY